LYKQFFGFLESPFSITPDPNFFSTTLFTPKRSPIFNTPLKLSEASLLLRVRLEQEKTTLLRKLMRELRNGIHFAFIYNTELTFNELLRVILTDLGLFPNRKDRLAMIAQLNNYLLEQLERGETVCLLIDEVQNLSDESVEGLRLLSNLETDREKLMPDRADGSAGAQPEI
jgi:general secretion pathway protein A